VREKIKKEEMGGRLILYMPDYDLIVMITTIIIQLSPYINGIMEFAVK